MQKFKYIGDDPVDVPALGLVDVEPGQTVEVQDSSVADGMDGSSIWEPVTKKAAQPRADDKTEG